MLLILFIIGNLSNAEAQLEWVNPPHYSVSLSYREATSFSFGDLAYSGCENGSVPPVILDAFDFCNGGVKTFTYNAITTCGELEPFFAIAYVLPSPKPEWSYIPSNISLYCEDPIPLEFGPISYSNNMFGFCEVSGVVEPMYYRIGDPCNGGSVTYVWEAQTICNDLYPISATLTYRPFWSNKSIDAILRQDGNSIKIYLQTNFSRKVPLSSLSLTVDGLSLSEIPIEVSNPYQLTIQNEESNEFQLKYDNTTINDSIDFVAGDTFLVLQFEVSNPDKNYILKGETGLFYVKGGEYDITGNVLSCTPQTPLGQLEIINNSCNNCQDGSISIGSLLTSQGILQYSYNNGLSWTSALPIYKEYKQDSILARSFGGNYVCNSGSILAGVTAPVGTCGSINWVGGLGLASDQNNWDKLILPTPCHHLVIPNITDIMTIPNGVNIVVKSLENKGRINIYNGGSLMLKP